MSKWSEAELSALDAVAADMGMAAYHKFGALTSYSKSYNAFEVKRRRVVAESPATRTAPEIGPAPAVPVKVLGIPEEYVGLTIAFFDIESTFSNQPIVLYAAIADNFGKIQQFRKGSDITDDRELVNTYARELEKYDIICGWNSKLFDQAVLNGRLVYHGLPALQPNLHIDLMWYASGSSMRIGRRSLASVSEYFDTPNRKTPLSVRTWDKAMAGSEEAYEEIVTHCDQDVLTTRDVFHILKRQVKNIHR